MARSESACLDYVERWMISKDEIRAYHNVLTNLREMLLGLTFLNSLMKKAESDVGYMFSMQPPISMVHSWFSVSARAFCMGIHSLASSSGLVQSGTSESAYTEAVIPGVRAFRDKIGAHLCGVMASSHDTDAFRALSTIGNAFTFGRGRIVAGGFTLRTPAGEATLPGWRLTETFEAMRMRYAPPAEGRPQGPVPITELDLGGISFGAAWPRKRS